MKSPFHIPLPQNRVFGLDLLRAAAILFVMIGHGNLLLPHPWQDNAMYLILDGVSIFFVLSGFLIGGILIRTFGGPVVNGKTLLHFWVRRWARTLPAYFLVLLFLCIHFPLTKPDFSLSAVAPFYFFSQNLAWPPTPEIFFPEAWSISVEEWFYLLTPLLLWGAIKWARMRPARAFLFVMAVVILAATSLRFYRWACVSPEGIENYADNLFRKQVATRLDHLMWGIGAAWLYYFYPKSWNRARGLKALLGLFLLLVSKFVLPLFYGGSPNLYALVFAPTVSALSVALLLPFLSAWKKEDGALAKALTRISLISYSVYLLNLSVVILIIIVPLPWQQWIPSAGGAALVSVCAFWAITLLLATLLYKYFELPMMKLRDHPRMKRLFAPPANT